MFLWWYILRKSGAANFQEQIFEFVWIQCRPWKHQVMIICWKDKDFKRQLSPEQILKSYHETSRSHLDKVCKSHIFPHCLNMGSCGKYMLIAFPSLWLVLWTKNTFWDIFKVENDSLSSFKNLCFCMFSATCLMYVWYECIWTPEFPETLCAALWLCSFWGLRKPLYWSRHPATFKHSKSLIKRLSFACKTLYPLVVSWCRHNHFQLHHMFDRLPDETGWKIFQ